MSASATRAWRSMLSHLLESGASVSPVSAGADFKGNASRELLGFQSRWDMSRPAIACGVRKLGYKFMCAEAAMILRGDNRLSSILPFAKHMANFSDDGVYLSGSYGPPFVEQVGWIVRALRADPASRQAVMTIWRPRPGPTKDTPCTVALQWLIRSDTLHCVATMRSSDAWTGIPYDVFAFSMMSAQVACLLRISNGPQTRLGSLILTAGSQHLYDRDVPETGKCLGFDPLVTPTVMFDQQPFPLDKCLSAESVANYLGYMADCDARQLMSHWGMKP